MKYLTSSKMMVLSCAVVLLTACGARPVKLVKAVSANPEYRVYNFNKIVVLPILDNRKEKKKRFNFDKKLKRTILAHLSKRKKYNVSFSSHYGSHKVINPDDINGATPAWIQGLGTNNGRYVMLLVIED